MTGQKVAFDDLLFPAWNQPLEQQDGVLEQLDVV
jgi:hypothetical protein